MSHQNGVKKFLFVVRHGYEESDGNQGFSTFLIRADHDPSQEELVKFLGLDFDEMHHTLDAWRYSEDEIPTLGPKTA
jgi:hypothetical protein